jgi:hypothetical protein
LSKQVNRQRLWSSSGVGFGAVLNRPAKRPERAGTPSDKICRWESRPFLVALQCTEDYVVARGLTATAVAGTALEVGTASVQPASLPPAETGVQAGRLGLICCVSVSVGTLM